MTLSDFKRKVASYLNRSPEFFVNDGVDNVLEAINDARRTAQLRYDFNALKREGFGQLQASGVDWETGLVTTPGGTAPLRLKKVEAVWAYDTVSADIIKGEAIWLESEISDRIGFTCPRARIVGTKLYGVNLSEGLPILVEGVAWLPDLTGTVQTDFFLDKGATWLLYQTVQNLNVFLKEDSRVQLADSIVQRAWADLVAWDGNLLVTFNSASLD